MKAGLIIGLLALSAASSCSEKRSCPEAKAHAAILASHAKYDLGEPARPGTLDIRIRPSPDPFSDMRNAPANTVNSVLFFLRQVIEMPTWPADGLQGFVRSFVRSRSPGWSKGLQPVVDAVWQAHDSCYGTR